ncbi:ADP-specific phosphofructokinase [Methanococcus voltae]|uniref:ADP-specific phosphofructokinase n=1 Tax=Methanococcus voltae PS TaxID=523842 RepID=A0ABT2EWL9_METVO|nr:ADP-specific phosphofructokinase [Methanococcus voltae]MBP2172529.1 ADP-dependent phosphofructokinase/glucokinase [Methanococcus voltae]MCS3922353.1 ADP-dependent phosphofructokinase/glucokinase [Methanococcus voltae PS]
MPFKNLNDVKEHCENLENIAIFLGYNANVDALKYISSKNDLYELLDEKNNIGDVKIDIDKVIENMASYPREIKTPEEFLARLILAMKSGKPVEIPLISANLSPNFKKWLEDLKFNEKRIGGQVGIIANLLSLLNLEKIIAYTPLLSKKQSEMFENKGNHANIFYPVLKKDGKVSLTNINNAYKDDETKINRIFEYKEFDFEFNNEKIDIPRANRLILASRPENLRIDISEDIKKELPEMGKDIDCAIVSGYQSIKEKYSDGKTDEYYFKRAVEDIKLLKSKNLDLKVHLEFASVQNPLLRKKIVEYLYPVVDCAGLDETEIANILNSLGYSELSEKILKDSRIEDVIEASKIVLEKYDLEMIQIHTIFYIMFICKKIEDKAKNDIKIAQLKKSLEFATILASSKAKNGLITSIEDLKMGLDTPYNQYGDLLIDLVSNISNSSEFTEYNIVLVPSRIVKNPKSTVGLGDTISSGAFVSYVADLKNNNVL